MKRFVLSVLLFLTVFALSYIGLSYLVPVWRLKLEADAATYFLMNLRHKALLKGIISFFIASLFFGGPLMIVTPAQGPAARTPENRQESARGGRASPGAAYQSGGAPSGAGREAFQTSQTDNSGVLAAILRILFVLLALLEIALLLFIGLRYLRAGAPADQAVTSPAVQAPAGGRTSYIGPGLYIKDGVVIYDYAGITGTAVPGGQG